MTLRRAITEEIGAPLPDDGIAMVTGGAKGIGRSIVEVLVDRGMHAIVIDQDRVGIDALEREFGNRVACHVMDAHDPVHIERLFGLVRSTHERLDVLVNNAARSLYGPATELSEEDWDETMRAVKGYFLCSRSAAQLMMPRHRGKIINVSSIAAHIGLPRTIAHAAAKAAVEGMTRVFAVELGPYNIQVNAVAPGPIETPGSRAVLSSRELELRRMRVPIGRLGSPQDVAGLVAFLASGDSDWLTGSVITVDGGYTIQGTPPLDEESMQRQGDIDR